MYKVRKLVTYFFKFPLGDIASDPPQNINKHSNSSQILSMALWGRTGNILFQLASGLSIAANYQFDLCLDRVYPLLGKIAPLLNMVPKTCPSNIMRRLNEGDFISIYNDCCVFEDFYVQKGGKWQEGKPRILIKKGGIRLSLSDLFGNLRGKLGDLYHMIGYRESWRYLVLGPERSIMRLQRQVWLSARGRIERLFPGGKHVAIHLRVGDASNPNHVYNFPGPKYFHDALEYFRRKWEKISFLVFCDNPGWCKGQSLFETKDVLIMERDPNSKVNAINDDLTMMSACHGVITSVGTFGWWAGYFSFQNGGDVVYFKNIYNISCIEMRGETAKSDDRFPPKWIGIEAPTLDRRGGNVESLKGDVLHKQLRK